MVDVGITPYIFTQSNAARSDRVLRCVLRPTQAIPSGGEVAASPCGDPVISHGLAGENTPAVGSG
jgi:hypothetical protein